MAWSNSKVFRAFLGDLFTGAVAFDLDTDTSNIALYDNTITPDQNVTGANSAYGAGVWSTTGGQTGTPQVYHTGQWAQGGIAITSPTVDVSVSAQVKFTTATNPVSGTAATMSNINGVLCYDSTRTSHGVCYNYFGSPVAVSAGKLTVVIPANGIMLFTL